MSSTTMLADIAHCPSKTGTDVSRVLEKQLARVGLNLFGVGENEGGHGIHSYFEALSPGYVCRRCLPHMAWRTGDMAIRESGLDYRALAAYFVDGITWARLRNCLLHVHAQVVAHLVGFERGDRPRLLHLIQVSN